MSLIEWQFAPGYLSARAGRGEEDGVPANFKILSAASVAAGLCALAPAQTGSPPTVIVSPPLRVDPESEPRTGRPIGVLQITPDNPGPGSWHGMAVEPTQGPSRGGWSGPAPSAVVLDSGRIVSVHTDERGGANRHNRARPFVMYSDDGGRTWLPDATQSAIWIDPFVQAFPATIDDAGAFATAPEGDSPSMIDQRSGAPTIAVDRGPEPDHVYVAWYAKSGGPTSTNTDIWIARSHDGGVTWDSSISSQMKLTDRMLGLTDPGDLDPITGVDQAMPAIAIDACGGINLMFYDNRSDPDRNGDREDWLDCYYVRITGFGPGAVVDHLERLTVESFPTQVCADPSVQPVGLLGHYHNMEASADGHNIWLAYIARETDPAMEWSGKNCYVHRVKICTPTPTDLNGDGLTSEPDAIAYTSAWSAQEPEADINLDWIVNTSDFVTFVDWYAQATE